MTHRVLMRFRAGVPTLCLAAILWSAAASALGGRTTLTPAMAVRTEYDDNVTFTQTNPQSDFVARFSPSLTLDYDTPRIHARPVVQVDVLRYLDDTNLNDEQYLLKLDADYDWTERLTATGGVSYREDTTIETEAVEQTGQVRQREDRFRFATNGGVSYVLNERSQAGLTYAYSRTAYATGDNVDFTSQSVVANYALALLDQKDVFTLQPSYVHYDSNVSDVDSYGLSAGYKHSFSETLAGTGFFGFRSTATDRTETVFRNGQLSRVQRDEKNWDYVADVSLERTGERMDWDVGYGRDLSYSSDGEPRNRDHVYAGTTARLSERLTAGLRGDFYRTQSEDSKGEDDTSVYRVTPTLHYRLTRSQKLTLGYSYAQSKDKERVNDETANRNRIWVTWKGTFPTEL